MSKRHLEFYKNSLRQGRMPSAGLCSAAEDGLINAKLFDLFTPSIQEIHDLVDEGVLNRFENISEYEISRWHFWACGLPISHEDRAVSFTPLRQTIVLFMAAINGEL